MAKNTNFGKKAVGNKPKTSTVTTSSMTESVSSFNTVEKAENKEFDQKQSGTGFKFATEFTRKTMNRTDLTSFIQKRYDQIWEKTDEFQRIAEDRYH